MFFIATAAIFGFLCVVLALASLVCSNLSANVGAVPRRGGVPAVSEERDRTWEVLLALSAATALLISVLTSKIIYGGMT